MAWFVAHALMVLRPQRPVDQPLFCWENLILLEAELDADLWSMAEKRALEVDASKEYERHSEYPVPARWEFAGIRKIVQVRNDTEEGRLRSGDELSYNTLLLDSQEDVDIFVSGDECSLRLAKDRADDE